MLFYSKLNTVWKNVDNSGNLLYVGLGIDIIPK